MLLYLVFTLPISICVINTFILEVKKWVQRNGIKLPEAMCLVSVGSQLDLLGLIESFFEPRVEKEVWWEMLSFDAAALES